MAAPDDLRRWQGLDLGYTDLRGAVWRRQARRGAAAPNRADESVPA